MVDFNYDDIDLYYYHAIDFDFSRLYSILNNGIFSNKRAIEEKLEYYYRNYTHSSSKNDYISISHYARTTLLYGKIENELYDYNINKNIFVVDGDIDALEKQHYKKRYLYTKERHVLDKIDLKDIKGILLREIDALKKIKDVGFNIKFSDESFLEQKIFTILNFLTKEYGYNYNKEKIYYLIGKYEEIKALNLDKKEFIKIINNFMNDCINKIFSNLLNCSNPTVLDVVKYINNDKFPIFIMNRFDVKKLGETLNSTDERLERIPLDVREQMHENGKKYKKEQMLIKNMSDYGINIYYEYNEGPFTKEDSDIVKKLVKIKES